MTKFGKIVVSSVLLIIVLVLAGLYYFGAKNTQTIIAATSFEECARQGNPIMESYPEQCTDKLGNHFTHNVPVATTSDDHSDLINITSPLPNATVTSPLVIKGQARGGWFFEAQFPVNLVDWDGKIIAEAPAHADGDWMTNDFVPYTATLTFKTATTTYSHKGTLILKKDNPSGLPQNDDAIEIPVIIK